MSVSLIIQALFLTAFIFSVAVFAYLVLFYGFSPFLPSRPEEIKKIIKEMRIKEGSSVCSLGSGSSGFLMVLEEHYPNLELVGVEKHWLIYWAAKLQVCLKKSRIKVVRSDYYWANIRRADIVYCYVSLKDIREIQRKLKIDTKPNALIVSNGFVIPYMESFKVVKLENKKKWYNFFNRGKEVVRTSRDEDKRDSKVYFYQV